ncbi:MAG TPA: 6-hydroxymethylpterin diphosphokinase MptE-like protein, partial [Candidatus Deferrimicrobium sp.]|nr:6-hydroxymethylpterin diphosphokinase MptE-like protein [Candidatus Deferrimicrobium sp.]
MSIHEENLFFLEKKFPKLLEYLQAVPDCKCKTETAKNGSLTLLYFQNQIPYYIHSKFNPRDESSKIIAHKNLSADHIIVMGLGLGYHLEKIMATKSRLARVLLIEPELEIVKHSLKTLRWQALLTRGDFFYVFGSSYAEITRMVHTFINIVTLDTVEYIELPSETRILKPFFTKIRQAVEEEIKTNIYDFKTRMAESYMLPRNILKNLPLIFNTRPATHLKNVFHHTPGFIVSAGPSLDKNILHLKKIRDRALLIAVDTALKPLLKRSIHPHITAIGDPSHKNYLHLQGTEKEIRHFVAAEACIAHQVFHDFRDKIFTLSVGKSMVRMIEEHTEPFGELEAWGSVISIALTLAVYMGLDPIIFVGQDFAFTGSRNHCRGTSWEDDILEYTSDPDQLQRFEKHSISGNKRVIETDDIYGQKVFTSDRLKLYKNYLAGLIEKYPHTRFINATEGGIFSEIESMPLIETIKQFVYGRMEIDFNKLHHLPLLNKKENIRRLLEFFKTRCSFFEGYQKKIAAALQLLGDIKDDSLSACHTVFP